MATTSAVTTSPSFTPVVLAAAAAFYPAWIAWYLLLAIVGYLLFAALLPVYYLGFGAAAQAIVSVWAVVRAVAASTVATLAFALVVSLAVALAVRRRQRKLPAAGRAWWFAIPLAIGVALLVDSGNALTSVGASIAVRFPENAPAPLPARAMTPRDFGSMQDRDTGTIARVTGVLVYRESLRRFELADSDDRGTSVTLEVRADHGAWIRDILADGVEPGVRDRLLPLVGKRVIATGPITRNSVSAWSRDVVAASPSVGAPASTAPPASIAAPAGVAPPPPETPPPATPRPP